MDLPHRNKTMPSQIRICIRGGGDIGSGVAWRLHRCGFNVFIAEALCPLAVRRKVAFCEAVYEGSAWVEGVEAVLTKRPGEISPLWSEGKIPVIVDPEFETRQVMAPEVVVDAILAKKNTGTAIDQAPLVIALGPGFAAGKDAHVVVETNRGHNLGRIMTEGSAEPDTGIPSTINGIAADRVLRAHADGTWLNRMAIGDIVKKGDIIGSVAGMHVRAPISGVLRGLIRGGVQVKRGVKTGDIDPRGRQDYCHTISDKALAVAGGVLEAILRFHACGHEAQDPKGPVQDHTRELTHDHQAHVHTPNK